MTKTLLLPKIFGTIADSLNIKVHRDVVNCDPNQGGYAGNDVWLGEFEDDDLEMVAFFHEIGHVVAGRFMKRETYMSILSREALAWEVGLNFAAMFGYKWDYSSKELRYARKCLFSYLEDDAVVEELKEVKEEIK